MENKQIRRLHTFKPIRFHPYDLVGCELCDIISYPPDDMIDIWFCEATVYERRCIKVAEESRVLTDVLTHARIRCVEIHMDIKEKTKDGKLDRIYESIRFFKDIEGQDPNRLHTDINSLRMPCESNF